MGLAQYPPVGLGYLATAARKVGHEVSILDCVKERMNFSDFRNFIRENEFEVIGLTVWSLALKQVKESLKVIKELQPKAITILGGPHPSALPEKTMAFFPATDFSFILQS